MKKQLLCSPQAVEDDAWGNNCISFLRLVMTAILAVVTAACTDLSVPCGGNCGVFTNLAPWHGLGHCSWLIISSPDSPALLEFGSKNRRFQHSIKQETA